MKALSVLAAVVLVLLLIGQIRVGGQAEFNAEGFFLWARAGRLRIKILPMKPRKKTRKERPKEAKKEKSKKAKKEKPKEPKKKKRPGKPGKEKPTKTLPEKVGGALEYARELLPVALEAADGILRGLRVDILRLELTAGSPDPADAASLYAQANAALGALWQPLTTAFRVKDGSARVKLDFDAPGMTVYGTAGLSIKIGTVLRIGLRAGFRALFGVLKLKRQQRKAA